MKEGKQRSNRKRTSASVRPTKPPPAGRNTGPTSASGKLGDRLAHFDKVLAETMHRNHELTLDSELLSWILQDVLTEKQLALVPPGYSSTLRNYVPRVPKP